MNQLNHYIPAVVQPGFTRSLFSANYCLTSDVAVGSEPADSHRIVLCIDRQEARPKANASKAGPQKNAVADSVAETFQAAIALAEQDPLLQCVSSWLQQDLDWRPMLLNTPISVDLTLSSTESTAHKIGLAFGQSAQSLPVFPAELDDIVKIQEHKQSLLVCLAQLALSIEDQQRVQPGSCMLLPDTFKAGCNVDLFDLQSDTSLAQVYLNRRQNQLSQIKSVSTDGRSASKLTSEAVADGASLDNLTRIVLKQPITVDMSEWFVETDDPIAPVQLGSLVGQIVVVKIHRTDGIEEYNAQLIEVGSGLAAVLENAG